MSSVGLTSPRSIVAKPNLPGILLIETKNLKALTELCHGVAGINTKRLSRLTPLDPLDAMDYLRARPRYLPKRGSFVRLTTGRYRRDIAYVLDVSRDGKLTLSVVPRIDYTPKQTLDRPTGNEVRRRLGVKPPHSFLAPQAPKTAKGQRKRPLPAPLDLEQAKICGGLSTLNVKKSGFPGHRFKRSVFDTTGFLRMKDVTPLHCEREEAAPSLQELFAFETCEAITEQALDHHYRLLEIRSLKLGDKVRVVLNGDEYDGAVGFVDSLEDDVAGIRLRFLLGNNVVRIPTSALHRHFEGGETIEVVIGPLKGVRALVVAPGKADKVLNLISKDRKREIVVSQHHVVVVFEDRDLAPRPPQRVGESDAAWLSRTAKGKEKQREDMRDHVYAKLEKMKVFIEFGPHKGYTGVLVDVNSQGKGRVSAEGKQILSSKLLEVQAEHMLYRRHDGGDWYRLNDRMQLVIASDANKIKSIGMPSPEASSLDEQPRYYENMFGGCKQDLLDRLEAQAFSTDVWGVTKQDAMDRIEEMADGGEIPANHYFHQVVARAMKDKPRIKVFFRVTENARNTAYNQFVGERGFLFSLDKAFVRLKKVTAEEINQDVRVEALENKDRSEMRIPYLLLEPVPPSDKRDDLVVCDSRSDMAGFTWVLESFRPDGKCYTIPNSRAKTQGRWMDAQVLARAKLWKKPKRH